jgi:hypothetical protein
VEKRVLGDVNHSKSDRLRNKESKLRNVCYNVYRHVKVVIVMVVKGFYKAKLSIIAGACGILSPIVAWSLISLAIFYSPVHFDFTQN